MGGIELANLLFTEVPMSQQYVIVNVSTGAVIAPKPRSYAEVVNVAKEMAKIYWQARSHSAHSQNWARLVFCVL